MNPEKFTILELFATPSGNYARYRSEDGILTSINNYGFKAGDVVEIWEYDGYAPKRIDINGVTTWNEQDRIAFWTNYDPLGTCLQNPYKKPDVQTYLGRNVIDFAAFHVDGTFESKYAAEKWIADKGYSCGSTCARLPTAIMKGDYYSYNLPEKWKNFNKEQRNSVHGVIVGNNRIGPVFVYLFQ